MTGVEEQMAEQAVGGESVNRAEDGALHRAPQRWRWGNERGVNHGN